VRVRVRQKNAVDARAILRGIQKRLPDLSRGLVVLAAIHREPAVAIAQQIAVDMAGRETHRQTQPPEIGRQLFQHGKIPRRQQGGPAGPPATRIDQRGCMRMAPSRRMVSPLRKVFSTIWQTSAAYSGGWPRRFGNCVISINGILTLSGAAFI